jgi:predicted RNA-binding Zn-ribbon protein involved in translation (DUF1610 family)
MIDYSAVISSVLSNVLHFWYLIPIILIVMFFKTPAGKGIIGEFLVNLAINIRLDKKKYHLLKNVTLPTKDGTTQIDHIIVSQYGIFIIETKNMKGWIFGDEHQKTWTQKIYKHTSKFQNPLYQNYKHTKTIESLLELEADKVFSIVTFVGESTFKTKMPKNVTHGGKFISFIKSQTNKLLSEKEVQKIVSLIENGQLSKTRKTNKEHVKHVKKIVKEKESTSICPKCGSDLVLRVSKQGINKGNKFYGCSNYPKCRHTAQTI